MSIERDQTPRPWPFPSTDPRVNEQAQADLPEEPGGTNIYCTCDNELTLQELDTGKCSACGGAITV